MFSHLLLSKVDGLWSKTWLSLFLKRKCQYLGSDFKVWGWSVQTESCPQRFKTDNKRTETCSSANYKPKKQVANPPKKRRADLCRFSRLGDGHTVRPHAATRYCAINAKMIGKRNRLNKCQDNDSPGQLNQMTQQVKIGIHTKNNEIW